MQQAKRNSVDQTANDHRNNCLNNGDVEMESDDEGAKAKKNKNHQDQNNQDEEDEDEDGTIEDIPSPKVNMRFLLLSH